MKTKAEIQKAIAQMNHLADEIRGGYLVDLSRAAVDVSRALAWAIGDPSDFGELLEGLDRVARAERQ